MTVIKQIFPKRIAVEFHHSGNRNVGVGEFSYQLARGLADRARELRKNYGIKFYFIVPREMRGHFGKRVNYIAASSESRLLVRLYPVKMDLFHSTHQYSKVKTLYFAHQKLLTIHDINFVYEKCGDKIEKYSAKLRRRLELADHVNFISQFAEQDVLKNFAPRHPRTVIYNGVTDMTKAPKADISRWNLPKGYLFHISSLLPKKNVHLLIEMMQYLPKEHLVLVGGWDNDYAVYLRNRIDELGLTNITTLDNVADSEKAALYEGCKALLFPSLCEGFGLPPLEAMYFGKPVFLSTLTSLPEVGGPEAFYWDTLVPKVMARRFKDAMAEMKEDPGRSDRIREWARRYDWNQCVDQYVDYYLNILGVKK